MVSGVHEFRFNWPHWNPTWNAPASCVSARCLSKKPYWPVSPFEPQPYDRNEHMGVCTHSKLNTRTGMPKWLPHLNQSCETNWFSCSTVEIRSVQSIFVASYTYTNYTSHAHIRKPKFPVVTSSRRIRATTEVTKYLLKANLSSKKNRTKNNEFNWRRLAERHYLILYKALHYKALYWHPIQVGRESPADTNISKRRARVNGTSTPNPTSGRRR